jgi:hypothetical protein
MSMSSSEKEGLSIISFVEDRLPVSDDGIRIGIETGFLTGPECAGSIAIVNSRLDVDISCSSQVLSISEKLINEK